MKRPFQRSGSSLILVLLVIAGIVTVTFGIQRITLVQFSQSSHEEDNIMAYYAAKAGIEDGLTRFRFDRDTQTADGKVFRYGLSDATNGGEVLATDVINKITNYQPTKQYYDLAVNFKTDRINVAGDGSVSFTADRKISKDDTLLLTGFSPSSSPYFLRMVFQADSSCPAETFVQVHYQTENGLTHEATLQLRTNSYDSRKTASNLAINPGSDVVNVVRFRAYYCDVNYALATTLNNDGSGSKNASGPTFDDQTTILTATGYFGSAKRTLIGTVNRTSGALIGIYDFSAYAGQGNIKQ